MSLCEMVHGLGLLVTMMDAKSRDLNHTYLFREDKAEAKFAESELKSVPEAAEGWICCKKRREGRDGHVRLCRIGPSVNLPYENIGGDAEALIAEMRPTDLDRS